MTELLLSRRRAAGLQPGDTASACAPCTTVDRELDLFLLVGFVRGLKGRGDKPLILRLL